MPEAVLSALTAVAGALLAVIGKWIVEWVRGRTEAQSARLASTGELHVALIEGETATKDRLWERVSKLEERLDHHDDRCDEKIARAISKSEAECERKINRKLEQQAWQLRMEFQRGLDEASE